MRMFVLLARFPSMASTTGVFIIEGHLERQNEVSHHSSPLCSSLVGNPLVAGALEALQSRQEFKAKTDKKVEISSRLLSLLKK